MPETALVHIPVENLVLPESIQVGATTFHPTGWLASHAERHGRGKHRHFVKSARENLDSHSHATATVRLPAPNEDRNRIGPLGDEARAIVRDALCVLRLYQVARYPMHNVRIQTFGLASELIGALERHWVTRRRRFLGHGWSRYGNPAEWTFSAADIEAFDQDARFAYISKALVRAKPTDFESRSLNAARLLSSAILEPRLSLQVVHLATAVESMFGDDQRSGSRYLRIAQRAAFVWCGMPEHPHGQRAVCPFLQAATWGSLDRTLSDRAEAGNAYYCTWFANVDELLHDRHTALHRAVQSFPNRRVVGHLSVAIELILESLSWIVRNGASHMNDLDAARLTYTNSGG